MRHSSQRLSIQHLWALAIIVGVFIFVNTHPIRPHDFWWHMAVGREILSTGHIPSVDTYSYTAAGEPYPSYKSFWLMDIILYLIYQVGGAALVVFYQSMIVTSAYLVVFLTCNPQGNNWRAAAFGVGLAALLGMNDWNVRPQAFTFLLGAIFLYLIQQLRRGSKRSWALLLPGLMVVWVNSHGTFPLGLFFLSLWVGQEVWDFLQAKRRKQNATDSNPIVFPLVILATSTLACLVNPVGFGVLQYQRSLWGNPVIQNLVVEWASPTFSSLPGGLFLGVLLLTALIFAISPRCLTLFQWGSFLGMAFLGLHTSRGIVWFGLVLAPVVAEYVSAIWFQMKGDTKSEVSGSGKPLLNWVIVGVLLTMAVISLPWFKEQLPMPAAKAGLISGETPIQATDYVLDAQPSGNIFHAMSFGSYLIWEAQPDYRVFVDGRIELYPEEVWQDYLLISNAMGDWEGKLAGYGVHTLMLSRSEQASLVAAVLTSGHWQLVYEDDAALVFISQ